MSVNLMLKNSVIFTDNFLKNRKYGKLQSAIRLWGTANHNVDPQRVESDAQRLYANVSGLLVTAGVAIYVAASPAIMSAIFSSKLTFRGLIIAEFACVIAITGAINKLSTFAATSLFFLYAVLNGVVFSSIFWAFELGSIAYTFAITAGVFGAMSIYGYLTSNDLTKMGSFLFMALIGLIITTIVNIFVGSSTLEWLISFAGVAIFIGLTAWDTQKIKQMVQYSDSSQVGKIATIGALTLYLDFINLFLYMLRFFGNSRN